MQISTRNTILLQVVCCLLFLGQPFWLTTRPPEEPLLAFSRPTIRDLIANGLMLGFFYLNYHVLIPGLYFTKRKLLYLLVIIAGFLTIVWLPSLLTGRHPFEPMHPGNPLPSRDGHTFIPPGGSSSFYEEVKHHIFLFAAVISFSLMLRIRNRLYKAEAARHEAELANLKAQINPHFLFNTLNSIYALAVKKDDKTADAVINLSELMRYVLKDARGNKIPLQTELSYVENYIDLQRSRLGNTADIKFSISGVQPAGITIAPLILISFIENAFKYGVNPDVHSTISVHIQVQQDTLQLVVLNGKVAMIRENISSGIGIHNTTERLQILYPGKHTLTIAEDEHHYQVNLLIELI